VPVLLHLIDGERRQLLEDYAFSCLFLSKPHAAVSLYDSRPTTLQSLIQAHSMSADPARIGPN
jgi:hypothetical protein